MARLTSLAPALLGCYDEPPRVRIDGPNRNIALLNVSARSLGSRPSARS
jgi:hypothetical protein